MRRWMGTLLAALLVAIPLLADDKGTDEKGNSRAKQFKEIQSDYKKAVPDAVKALQAAKTTKDREAVFEKLNKEFAPRILKLVEADPKNDDSFTMLLWAVVSLPNVDNKVFDLLAENWAKDKKIKELCQMLTTNSRASAKKVLEKVAEENKDKEAQGLAYYALATINKSRSESEGDLKAGEQAEKQFERVSKDFADVKAQRGTVGDQAKSSLEEIRKCGIGKKMPNLGSEDLQGGKVQLKDYKGKVVVLDIWATWCGPCKAMIPHEREMVEKLKDKPFTLISISADAKKETLEKFLESTKMPWTHWWNGQNGGILKELEVQFFPTIYVLDGDGVIRYKNIRGEQLEKAVEKLLANAKDKK